MISFGTLEGNLFLEEKRLGTMLILSCIIHFLGFSLLFFLPGLPFQPQINALPDYTPVKLINLRDLPGNKSIIMQKAKEELVARKPKQIQKQLDVKRLEAAKVEIPKKSVLPQKSSKKNRDKQTVTAQKEEEHLRQAIGDIRDKIANGANVEASRTFGIKGGAGAADIPELIVYTSIVVDRIMESWFLPPALKQKASYRNWLTIIDIRIDRDGKVFLQGIERSSGNSLFDTYALGAIKKIQSDSFPPLPKVFRNPFLELGIRFHPSEKSNS